MLFFDKLLNSVNSNENSDEIELPLLILTGGESESVSLILLISLSQFWIDFTISFNSKQLVLFNSVFKGVIVFKDSLRDWDLEYTEKKSLTNEDSFLLNIKKIIKKN